MAAAGISTCGIAAGTLKMYCWGGNDYGQLDMPAGVSQWVAVSIGPRHTCGIAAVDLKLYCWGSKGMPSSTGVSKLDVPAGVSAWLVSGLPAAGFAFVSGCDFIRICCLFSAAWQCDPLCAWPGRAFCPYCSQAATACMGGGLGLFMIYVGPLVCKGGVMHGVVQQQLVRESFV